MRVRVDCHECGRECSHGFLTHRGQPYHFGCVPLPAEKRPREAPNSPPRLISCKSDHGAWRRLQGG